MHLICAFVLFTLTASVHAAKTLRPGETIMAYMPQIEEWSDGVNRYTFTASVGDQVVLEVTSKEFDTVVLVHAPAGERFRGEDPTGFSSRVSFKSEQEAKFEVYVSPSFASQFDANLKDHGAYELRLEIQGGGPAPANIQEVTAPSNIFVSIGTDLQSSARSGPEKPWSFWTSWHKESDHGAQMLVDSKCRSERREDCYSEASDRGGCVVLVEGLWMEEGEPERQQAGFLVASTFEDLVIKQAVETCETHVRRQMGKSHLCRPIVRICSDEQND